MVHSFQWSGGGEWAGKAWSAELPTDTALLLFLFSAFLAVRPILRLQPLLLRHSTAFFCVACTRNS